MASSGERYRTLKEEGRCVDCGCVLPPRWEYVRCFDCREQVRTFRAKPKTVQQITSLDEMAKEAHEKHISYGRLQSLKMTGRRDYEQTGICTICDGS